MWPHSRADILSDAGVRIHLENTLHELLFSTYEMTSHILKAPLFLRSLTQLQSLTPIRPNVNSQSLIQRYQTNLGQQDVAHLILQDLTTTTQITWLLFINCCPLVKVFSVVLILGSSCSSPSTHSIRCPFTITGT